MPQIVTEPALSFIVATTGRPGLKHALRSIQHQALSSADEIIVVGNPVEEYLPEDGRFYALRMEPGNNWGHKERQHALGYASGTHLVFVDDDDALLPGAVTSIRYMARKFPGRPLMFKMIDPNGAVIWHQTVVQQGNHGTPCFVPPNVPEKLGTWGDRYEGDFDFCTSTLALYPENALVWCADIIYGCRTFGGQH